MFSNASSPSGTARKKILALSSGGGHWEQLMIIRRSFGDADVVYANTIEGLGEKSGVKDCHIVRDCNISKPVAAVRCFKDVRRLIKLTQPDIIVTTGALPGLLALVVGKFKGIHGMWIDSVANGEQLSLSGKVASRFTDLCLTQWPSVAQASQGRVKYIGSVL